MNKPSQPQQPGKFSHLKSRLAIIGLAGSAAIYNSQKAGPNEYLEPSDQIEQTSEPIATPPLTTEQLRSEYDQLSALHHINDLIGGTRRKVYQTAKFLIRFAPNLIKEKIKQTFGKESNIGFDDLEKMQIMGKDYTPLVDLGSFDLSKLRSGQLNYQHLIDRGIKELVIMEDRDPQFFLNYSGYDADRTVPLNRHGNASDLWTMGDLKKLVDQLHQNNIKATIGFWGNNGNLKNNPFLAKNEQALTPVIPGSDDINPLAFVDTPDHRNIPFADYVVEQYQKLKNDFAFDGLFLGDGLMGYRNFLDPHGPYDASGYSTLWTDFYKRIFLGIKTINPNDTLWAYDCLGRGRQAALKNGLDLEAITPYIDHYIFQSYGNDAWGKDYMDLPGYDNQRDASHLNSLPAALKKKTKYTIGLGDKVEGWTGHLPQIKAKHQALSPDARQGTLGVWSTSLLRKEL